MKRLKCWKKQPFDGYYGNDWWKHKQTGKTVSVSSKTHGTYFIYTPPYNKIERDTKPEALSFAQKYMEEHNSC